MLTKRLIEKEKEIKRALYEKRRNEALRKLKQAYKENAESELFTTQAQVDLADQRSYRKCNAEIFKLKKEFDIIAYKGKQIRYVVRAEFANTRKRGMKGRFVSDPDYKPHLSISKEEQYYYIAPDNTAQFVPAGLTVYRSGGGCSVVMGGKEVPVMGKRGRPKLSLSERLAIEESDKDVPVLKRKKQDLEAPTYIGRLPLIRPTLFAHKIGEHVVSQDPVLQTPAPLSLGNELLDEYNQVDQNLEDPESESKWHDFTLSPEGGSLGSFGMFLAETPLLPFRLDESDSEEVNVVHPFFKPR